MESSERELLLQEISEQNSRLQRLIEAIAQLVARSRDVLRHLRAEASPSSDDGNSQTPS